jgi:hypothetical protein
VRLIKKNRRSKDCGVVAAFNAASWCNVYKPYREIEKFARGCGYNRKRGIYNFQFASLMKKLNVPAKKVKPRSIEQIESKLYLGKFFVLLYRPTGDIIGHAIVAFSDHKGHIRVINPDSQRITWGDLVSDVRTNGMKEFHVYEIPRRQVVTKNDDS